MPVTLNGRPIVYPPLPPKTPLTVFACIACGSENIDLWECGYNSFNPGGGRCKDCGREVREMLLANPSAHDLAQVWNTENNVLKRMCEIEHQTVALEKEWQRLKELYDTQQRKKGKSGGRE